MQIAGYGPHVVLWSYHLIPHDWPKQNWLGFPDRDLQRAAVGFDTELALHTIADNLETQFAHPGNNRLAGFLTGGNAERRIFLRQAAQRPAQLVLIAARLGLDGHANNGRRKIDLF